MTAKFIEHPEGLALLLDPDLVRTLNLDTNTPAEITIRRGAFIVSPLRFPDEDTLPRPTIHINSKIKLCIPRSRPLPHNEDLRR